MAAGIGKRMFPVTLSTPKPLVKIHGMRMIDTIIQGLKVNEIKEIIVVVGYLKEQFQVLEQEYSEVKLIENPYYRNCNNISSLYVAREYLDDVMIIDGDQIIYNPQILSPEFERSGYNCIWCEKETKEWLLTVEGNVVKGCSRTGGKSGWQLFSISRWTKEDGEKLKKHLEHEFKEKGNTQIYWDDIALFCYPEEYQLGIHKMEQKDIKEIDDLSDLAKIDESYQMFIKGGR